MYEEHEDGSFTLHMCEWYEQGRRLVGEYETLADGSCDWVYSCFDLSNPGLSRRFFLCVICAD